jgi:hypothetical protein
MQEVSQGESEKVRECENAPLGPLREKRLQTFRFKRQSNLENLQQPHDTVLQTTPSLLPSPLAFANSHPQQHIVKTGPRISDNEAPYFTRALHHSDGPLTWLHKFSP